MTEKVKTNRLFWDRGSIKELYWYIKMLHLIFIRWLFSMDIGFSIYNWYVHRGYAPNKHCSDRTQFFPLQIPFFPYKKVAFIIFPVFIRCTNSMAIACFVSYRLWTFFLAVLKHSLVMVINSVLGSILVIVGMYILLWGKLNEAEPCMTTKTGPTSVQNKDHDDLVSYALPATVSRVSA